MNPIGIRFSATITVIDGSCCEPSSPLSLGVVEKAPILRYAVYPRPITSSSPIIEEGDDCCTTNSSDNNTTFLCNRLGEYVSSVVDVVRKSRPALGVSIMRLQEEEGKEDVKSTTTVPLMHVTRRGGKAKTSGKGSEEEEGDNAPLPLLSLYSCRPRRKAGGGAEGLLPTAPSSSPPAAVAVNDELSSVTTTKSSAAREEVPIQWSFLVGRQLQLQQESVGSGDGEEASVIRSSSCAVETIRFDSRTALVQQLRKWVASSQYHPTPSTSCGKRSLPAPVPSWVTHTLRELETTTTSPENKSESSGDSTSSVDAPYELVFVPYVQRHPAVDRSYTGEAVVFCGGGSVGLSAAATAASDVKPVPTILQAPLPPSPFTEEATSTATFAENIELSSQMVVVAPPSAQCPPSSGRHHPSSSSYRRRAPFPMATPLSGLVDEIAYLISLRPKYGS